MARGRAALQLWERRGQRCKRSESRGLMGNLPMRLRLWIATPIIGGILGWPEVEETDPKGREEDTAGARRSYEIRRGGAMLAKGCIMERLNRRMDLEGRRGSRRMADGCWRPKPKATRLGAWGSGSGTCGNAKGSLQIDLGSLDMVRSNGGRWAA
ncbi:hypothetical protein GQ457_17G011670 [Hibiscus cannabinus]